MDAKLLLLTSRPLERLHTAHGTVSLLALEGIDGRLPQIGIKLMKGNLYMYTKPKTPSIPFVFTHRPVSRCDCHASMLPRFHVATCLLTYMNVVYMLIGSAGTLIIQHACTYARTYRMRVYVYLHQSDFPRVLKFALLYVLQTTISAEPLEKQACA